MEALTRLVTDSLARHGFDRPIDPRRLQWSRWFRCDSPHSLLVVPSKPGIFAMAEEVAAFCGGSEPRRRNLERSEGSPATNSNVGTAALESLPRAQTRGPAEPSSPAVPPLGGAALQRCASAQPESEALATEATAKRMLAVLQFSEDDDMAFTLDRMFTRINPMRARLSSGGCFLRFVVVADQDERRSICSALNQWLLASAEKASGIPPDFSSSLEVSSAEEPLGAGTTRVGRTLVSAQAGIVPVPAPASEPKRATDLMHRLPHLDSGANKNLHCPHPLPSGF
jgi:hypothetical protein